MQRVAERFLGGWLGQKLENWERQRKIRRFNAQPGPETRFSEQVCKGHYNGYAGRTLNALAEQTARFPWLNEVDRDI